MTTQEFTKVITDKTPVTLGVLISSISLIIALVLHAAKVEAKIDIHAKEDDYRVHEMERRIERSEDIFRSIDIRLSRIEGKLGVPRGKY